MVQTGRCLCGHVRYELEGELPPLVNCHCQFCRRAHAAAFVTLGWVPRTSFRILSGEDALQRFREHQDLPDAVTAALKTMGRS